MEIENVKERSEIITQHNPDIIFIQECNKSAINFDENYDYIDYSIRNNEQNDIYLKKNSSWKQE